MIQLGKRTILILARPGLTNPTEDQGTMGALAMGRELERLLNRGGEYTSSVVIHTGPGDTATPLATLPAYLEGVSCLLQGSKDSKGSEVIAVIGPSSDWASLIMPTLAARLGTALLDSVTRIGKAQPAHKGRDGGGDQWPVRLERMSHGGRIVEGWDWVPDRDGPLVATGVPSAFLSPTSPCQADGWAFHRPTPPSSMMPRGSTRDRWERVLGTIRRITPASKHPSASGEGAQWGGNLDTARIIVAGGRGCGGPEGFHLITQLAKRLGGAVGASRAAVDGGWADCSMQVGQTGKTVAPELYLAVGISGAVQHLAGIRRSGKIMVINQNPNAPIMDFADEALIGDSVEMVTGLLDVLG